MNTTADDVNTDTGEVMLPAVIPVSAIIARDPVVVVNEAQGAAKVLMDKIKSKEKPVIINGEQYLEFGDWQTVGAFWSCTIRTAWTRYLDLDGIHGYEAMCEVVNQRGAVISSAEAMCLNDEARWKARPLYMIRSMAQTRAGSKALRMAFGWVAEMAGYRSTPAEEMDGVHTMVPQRTEAEEAARIRRFEDLRDEIAGMTLDKLDAISTETAIRAETVRMWKTEFGDWLQDLAQSVKARRALIKTTPAPPDVVTPPATTSSTPATCYVELSERGQYYYDLFNDTNANTIPLLQAEIRDMVDDPTLPDSDRAFLQSVNAQRQKEIRDKK